MQTSDEAWQREAPDRAVAWHASLAAVAVLVALPVLLRLTADEVPSDIMTHARLSESLVREGGWVSYSVWFLLLQLVTIGTNDDVLLRVASVALLALLVASRAALVFVLASRALRVPLAAWLVAVASILVMPIVNPARPDDIYLGQLAANVWHNSTSILAAPLALVFFAATVAFLRKPNYPSAGLLAAFAVASVLAKPNFALALLPVLAVAGVVCLHRQRVGFARATAMAAIVFGPVLLLLALQYALTFAGSGVRDTTLAFRPFAVWSLHTHSVPLSLVLSLAGPAAVLVAMDRERRRRLPVVLSWATVGAAVAQLAALAEIEADGSVSAHANWFWGGHLAVMVLFVVSLVELARAAVQWPRATRRRTAIIIAGVVMLLHLVSGIVYLGGIVLAGNSPF